MLYLRRLTGQLSEMAPRRTQSPHEQGKLAFLRVLRPPSPQVMHFPDEFMEVRDRPRLPG